MSVYRENRSRGETCERWSKSEPDELISTTFDALAREYFAKAIQEERDRQRAVEPDLLVTSPEHRSRQ
jgi:hypothetical protein